MWSPSHTRNANRAKWEGEGANLAGLLGREGPHLWASSTPASSGLFLTYLSELRPPLLWKAPWVQGRSQPWTHLAAIQGCSCLLLSPAPAPLLALPHHQPCTSPTPTHLFIHSFTELSEGGRGQSYEQDRHGSSSCGVEHPAGKTDTCGLWSLAAWIHTSQSGSFVSVTLHAEPLPGLSFLLCRMGIVIVASS